MLCSGFSTCKFEMYVYLCIISSVYIFGIWPYGRKQTYTRVLQCCPASVGLTQGCPNKYRYLAIGGRYFITNYTQVETAQLIQTSSQCCLRTSTLQINSQFVSHTDEQNNLKMMTFRCCLDKW